MFECEYFGITIENTWEKLLYANSKIIKFNVRGKIFVVVKNVLEQLNWFVTYFSNTPIVINNDEYFINIDLDEFHILLKYYLYKDKKEM